MSFKMLKEAERYYDMVDGRGDQGAKYKVKFDFYYLCLMAGFHFRELGSESQNQEIKKTAYFVDYYPEAYRDKIDLIVGLLIDAEMERKAITSTDKKGIELLMVSLIDHLSVTKLSSKGHEFLNDYAVGGYNRIKDAIPATSELEVFMIMYSKLLNNSA
ncbi:hypothetical protein [Paenibacillus roseipurpureus]|uniref:Uncharacterized protein n=1 Tax=Paenibacillus roseopurpureus TaxID=2918901 RepID=A0AA96LV04_9BACL|nr:hypothetical protein [Paenibacillus sp. MBLB1832]WNR45130.1 hypothetical protein MJB10_02975 [Paenibacillus sp. MBLB1832]